MNNAFSAHHRLAQVAKDTYIRSREEYEALYKRSIEVGLVVFFCWRAGACFCMAGSWGLRQGCCGLGEDGGINVLGMLPCPLQALHRGRAEVLCVQLWGLGGAAAGAAAGVFSV